MPPERLEQLDIYQGSIGYLLDVRELDYLPVRDAEVDYSPFSDALHLTLPFPKNVTVYERPAPVTSYRLDEIPEPTMRRIADHANASTLANALLTKVRNMELENAQLKHQINAAKKDDTKERAKRHLERYRRKFKAAQEAGDHASAALADQRAKALEALINP